MKIRVDVNEETQESDVAPRTLLVHWLREDLALTGTHIGCETSPCGACTVHVDDRAVKSCTMFAVQADGKSVRTIEAMGAAVQRTADRKGRIDQIRIGVTRVNPMPFRATSVEARLAGQSPDAAALRALCAWIDEADPAGDLHASAESRTHLAGVFVARAVEKAIERAKE